MISGKFGVEVFWLGSRVVLGSLRTDGCAHVPCECQGCHFGGPATMDRCRLDEVTLDPQTVLGATSGHHHCVVAGSANGWELSI